VEQAFVQLAESILEKTNVQAACHTLRSIPASVVILKSFANNLYKSVTVLYYLLAIALCAVLAITIWYGMAIGIFFRHHCTFYRLVHIIVNAGCLLITCQFINLTMHYGILFENPQDGNKKIKKLNFLRLLLFEGTFTSFSKIKSQK
jgi:hypothetical protein